MKLDGEDMTRPTTDGQTEISVKGDWVKVQALYVNGTTIIVRGRWLKTAFVHDEAWLETGVQDPELCIRRLKKSFRTGREYLHVRTEVTNNSEVFISCRVGKHRGHPSHFL